MGENNFGLTPLYERAHLCVHTDDINEECAQEIVVMLCHNGANINLVPRDKVDEFLWLREIKRKEPERRNRILKKAYATPRLLMRREAGLRPKICNLSEDDTKYLAK